MTDIPTSILGPSASEDFRVLFLESPLPMAKVDLDGTILCVNLAMSEFFGYSPTELVGVKFHAITHPDDLSADLESYKLLVAGKIPHYSMVKRFMTKTDLPVRKANLTVTPFKKDGKVISALGVLRDTSIGQVKNVKVTPKGNTVISIKLLAFIRENWQWFAGFTGVFLISLYKLIRFLEEVSKQTGVKLWWE